MIQPTLFAPAAINEPKANSKEEQQRIDNPM
jgi:hypothetical protein